MRPERRDGGFSSVEAVLIMSMIGMATLSMGHSIMAGQKALGYVEDDTRILDQAQVLISRMTQIPFGSGAETAASAPALAMLVAVENDLFGSSTGASGANGQITQTFTGATVTLTQVRLASPMSWQYAVQGRAYYGLGGTWQIIVDRDVNGDGDTLDPVELATSASQDLFRIEIRYDGRRVLRTVRTRQPSE